MKTDEDFSAWVEKVQEEEFFDEGSRTETLEMIFYPQAPNHVRKFFTLMETHIRLTQDGMGGVGLRESKEGMIKILKKHKYDYEFYSSFITRYENALLNQYYESRKEDKDS